MPLARATRGPAQAHGRGGTAPAHRGRANPLARPRGPRRCRPPVDLGALAGPHVRRAPVTRVRNLTPARRHASQSPQHHAPPKAESAGARQSPTPSAAGDRPEPGGGRGDGSARGARCRPARPGEQRKDLPRRGRSPGRPPPERGGSPCATPGDAPDRERRPAGTRRPRGSPLRILDGVAHVQPVGPTPIDGGHTAADGRRVGHVPPQQRPSPVARPEDPLPHGRSPVPEPGAGHVPGRSVRAGGGVTRTWNWTKSQYSWKSRARRPPAAARPTRYKTAPGRPPHTPSCARRSPESRPGVPPSHTPHTRPAAGPTRACPPPPLQDQGCPPQRASPLARAPGHPAAPPRRHDPRVPGAGLGDHPHPPLRGSARAPPPPSRRPRRGTGCTPSCEHRTSPPLRGSTLCGSPRHRPPTPGGPGPLAPPRTGSCGAASVPRGSPASRPDAGG